MGGDLDSTNVIKSPLVCAFASISMDHIGILGNTLREIATCKSGIIKPGAAVVTGPQDPEVMEVLEAAAESMDCRITRTEDCTRKEHSRRVKPSYIKEENISFTSWVGISFGMRRQH